MVAQRFAVSVNATLLLACITLPAHAQQPLRDTGQTVTPVFEGWYRNADGTYSLSFGYYNRNAQEVLEIPVGPNNRIEPGGPNRGQPTNFAPRRHWGVFAVTVPADFGETKRVVWTLVVRGQTFSIPGSLKRGWEIDGLGEAGTGNTPPVLRFSATGPEARGPGGITGPNLAANAGVPLTLDVWASDDGRTRRGITGAGEGGTVTLTWFKHQGPGAVTFEDNTPTFDRAAGKATTTATFAEPGLYILRVRANDSPMASAGHAQCCWTNAFVQVTVTR